ncbi:LPXTG cell wall anchor domain-containing protein [Enterococcus faecalis]|uniref:LPXTG cell wall anchor domain-containing protein n=1 Tax=Enterococcus faecalis TaxID=1351 RepID=UPI0025B0E280|nr:LPXTG cell wall anchor domain-containing protein [Enterococcus faecalis]MDN3202353.1 LPXTG cell wall anchor domain-containing protein [Enterococcus faecalis]
MRRFNKLLLIGGVLGMNMLALPVDAATITEETPLQVVLERKIAPVPLPGNPDINTPGGAIDKPSPTVPVSTTATGNKAMFPDGNNGNSVTSSSVTAMHSFLFSSLPETGSAENKLLWGGVGVLSVALLLIFGKMLYKAKEETHSVQ